MMALGIILCIGLFLTCTMWHFDIWGCHGAMWAYVLSVDITCSYRALWLVSEVWRGPVGSVMSRRSDRLYDFVSYAINGVNRWSNYIKWFRVRVERVICKTKVCICVVIRLIICVNKWGSPYLSMLYISYFANFERTSHLLHPTST